MTSNHDFPRSDRLLVTIRNLGDAYRDGRDAIEQLERGDPVDQPDTVAFPTRELLFETFTPHTLELLDAIRNDEPTSIREVARLVDRDVKNVHEELTRLEAMGVIRFEEAGRAKQPVFPYDELVISVPFTRHDSADEARAG